MKLLASPCSPPPHRRHDPPSHLRRSNPVPRIFFRARPFRRRGLRADGCLPRAGGGQSGIVGGLGPGCPREGPAGVSPKGKFRASFSSALLAIYPSSINANFLTIASRP